MTLERDTTAIVGAGYLGAALARALPGPVIATTRSGTWGEEPKPPNVRCVALDVSEASIDPRALEPARNVVVCYAPGRTQDRHTLYVEGTQRLLRALQPSALRRFIYVGSTSALPDIDGPVDETCTSWPQTTRGIVQRQAERVVQTQCDAANTPWFVLRLGGLYGPGRELDRIYRRRSPSPMAGDGWTPTNLVHRDDAIAAIVAALRAPPNLQGIVHVCDDDHTPRRQMYATIAARRGLTPVTWEQHPPDGAAPRGKRVSNARLKNELGVKLQFPQHFF